MGRVTNWAGNLTYSTERILRPRSVAEAQELIAAADTIRPLGTRHSFSQVADSDGTLLSTEHLDRIVEIGDDTVTVEAGIRYGELAAALDDHGAALLNFASLPHISVGGAIATATHGSGATNQSLAAAVSALELVDAGGALRQFRRGDSDFDGAVVSLGALGLVTRVSLDLVPAFDLRQYVFEQLPWSALEADLAAILAGAYSVSLFTMWDEPAVGTVWVKTQEELGPHAYFGAAPATEALNPVPGAHAENATPQLGVPGPSYDRLPHFRLGFTPSSGDELQSEYHVAREVATEALAALDGVADRIAAVLQICELRTVAADPLWLSPNHGRDSLAIHFTWIGDASAVTPVVAAVEERLAPFAPRPHWGKVFGLDPAAVAAAYPRFADFRALLCDLDPAGKFRTEELDRYLPRR
jgi:xylitol oxidase